MLRLLILSLIFFASGCSRDDDPAASNDPLAKHTGRWLVVNYWAEWCKPCREEIPELNQFSLQHKATTNVVGINFDGANGDMLQQQARQLGIAFELMTTDPAQRGHWPKPQVLPTTLIVDPAGKLVQTLTGPQTQASLSVALETAQETAQSK